MKKDKNEDNNETHYWGRIVGLLALLKFAHLCALGFTLQFAMTILPRAIPPGIAVVSGTFGLTIGMWGFLKERVKISRSGRTGSSASNDGFRLAFY